jgi:hypothetical protein
VLLGYYVAEEKKVRKDPVQTYAYSFNLIIPKSPDFPGRAVRYLPAPPQIRTSSFPASGSSVYGFAKEYLWNFLALSAICISTVDILPCLLYI